VKWTYHAERFPAHLDLEVLGGMGWELVAADDGWVYFKRPARELKATTDRDACALATKFLYAVLNRVGFVRNVRACRKEDYWCEWVYPYGFVPEAGCPRHD